MKQEKKPSWEVIVIAFFFAIALPVGAYVLATAQNMDPSASLIEVIAATLWRSWAALLALYIMFLAVRSDEEMTILPSSIHTRVDRILPGIGKFRLLPKWKKNLTYTVLAMAAPMWETYVAYLEGPEGGARLVPALTHAGPAYLMIGVFGAIVVLGAILNDEER
ncbi:MAG: hypothetical protein EP340_04135 [Alphaproteobacteria bacterium]|nr:MAG: hypothetical protein EP340_04135 [Alphaproteobacteria bacterium]